MRQNPHVRICGGPGSATTLVYPTPDGRVVGLQTTLAECTAPGSLDTHLCYAAWRSSYSSRASIGV